nr:GHKL domain-containing protein [uncultured Acetatifactor sp.]
MLLPFFQLSLAIRNVWPQRMSMKAFIALYMLLLLAGMPVTLLSCIPYGLFAIPAAVCIYGLITCRDTAAQNVCMGMIGFILTIVTVNLLTPLSSISRQYISFGANLIYTFLFYLITLFCGRLLKKLLLSGKGVLRFQQTWYLIDAASLLLITIYLFDNLIPGQNGSVGKMIYNNVLHILGYLLVMLFLLFAMRYSYLEKIQTEAKQKALQDLQDYTHNLEIMYNGLRSFKHDYINILLSLSGYIANSDMDELKQFFETNIFPTKNLIDQGDYKLNQLGNIGVLEIKSLLSAKLIYAHESGIDVTIDIPDRVDDFPMDTVDLARILGIFLDNAIEAASAMEQPQIGLNIIQHDTGVSIIISNGFQDNGAALHKLKQSGFSTKTGHQGIGLSNAQKIINSYDNVLLETTVQHGCFMQHMELADGKE